MGLITSRRFRRKTEDSSSGDKAFSYNDIARNDQPWTPFEFSKPSKSVSAGQCLASISDASESQGHLTAVNSATLKPHLGALEDRPLVGHRSELTIASESVDHFDRRKPHQRLASSDVILRKNATGSGNGRKLEGVLFSNDPKVSELLSQTVTFLAYEIDPILIAEFIRQRAKRINRRTASAAAGETGRCGEGGRWALCDSDEDVSKILSRIVSDLNSDEYRSFCDLIRTIGCDGHVLDFLEALDDLLRMMTSSGAAANQEETPVLETRRRAMDPCGDCTCCLSSDDERIFWNQKSSSSSSSSYSVGDRRFEIRFVYADRESRLAQSFPDVEQLKRRKRRRSRLPTVDGGGGRAAVVGDTSDRYVPMISVHLFNACLCDSQMRRLGRILETKTCVRDLSIARTQLDTPAKVRLGHAVGRNVGLFQLDLRGSTLGNDGAMYLANSLRHNRSVRILNLSLNGINGRGCAVLARALARNRTVTDLDLGSNEVGDAGCGCLSVLIGENCSLRRLRLASNAIGADGAALLFLALRTNSQLQSLDVADNDRIGDVGMAVLSEVLILNHTLTELTLDRCGVSDVGCKAFARTLKANMKLRRLRLADNPLMMDDGLSCLAEGIKFNRSLEDLDFSGCCITDVGLLRLLDAARYNGTLKSVRLCRNDIAVTSRASFPSVPSSWHRIWAWKILETGGDSATAAAAAAAADTPVDAFEIYTKLRQANPNLSIVLKENGITRTVV